MRPGFRMACLRASARAKLARKFCLPFQVPHVVDFQSLPGSQPAGGEVLSARMPSQLSALAF